MLLAPAFLDELRNRTLLSALIGKSVKLQKAGREYKACCPFHQEKSPSFYVNDEKGFYHCFGCSAHGDAIRFLTEAKGLPFMDAVKELASAAGMQLPAPDRLAAEKAERAAGLHDVTEAAAAWFTTQLDGLNGGEARLYLERRGITAETARAFRIGFAPDGRNRLAPALPHIDKDKLVEAGLLIQPEGEGQPYDRFRGRLMIPIRDQRGRVIAFGGRILGAGEPKYLNSPETPLFDKGRTLFNLDRAAPASRKAERIIVVEGYLDVIALDQAGISEVVAPLGTALTEAQLERLWRLADVPILCFDGDKAGQKAAVRAAIRALPLVQPGRTLRFALLPDGQDPDDLVRSGGIKAFEKLLSAAISLDELIWNHELAESGPLDTPEDRAGLGKRLRDHARLISDDFLQKQYLGEFNRRLYEHFDALREGRRAAPARRKAAVAPIPIELRRIAEHGIDRAMTAPSILYGLAHHPGMIARHAETFGRMIFVDLDQKQAQKTMLESALTVSPLDTERLETILKQEGQAPFLAKAKRSNHIAFSFLRSNADRERAEHDLGAVIEQLAAASEIKLDRAAVARRLGDVTDTATFEELLRLHEEERKLMGEYAARSLGEDSAAH
ncbi:DNA primase [Sphingomonas oleivorans]|uniref:DNA primase n=1 Tax=Sphingomonas oleivorans TaxID=1735121 RepID=A0A2T5FWN5_9SPHN|nr:DNA primase [Sphingomonas oleivorans]PTQ10194.1 DNA primase [Sphingomonas oleivorans]